LKDQGKPEEAAVSYRRALELKPDYAEAHYNLGSVLEEIGDLQGAEDSFRAALRHNSRFAAVHYKLAELLGGKLPQHDLAAQRRLLEERELTDAERLLLHFGLAQVLDARGEHAEAAAHFDRGNALQRSEWRKCGQEYDPKRHEFLVTRMIGVFTPDFFERVRGFGLESEIPVFVVGLPRSGTTLVEQILAGHSRVFGAGEIKLASDTMAMLGGQGADVIESLRRLDRQAVGRLASRHLERLRALSGTALRIVDKTPENYLYLGLLAGLFPRAKFIHCRRDLRDVAVSCWMTHFREVCWASDQQHIASRFHEYQRLMEHWRKVLPAPLWEVDYEETVADLDGVARKLVAWCGLAWEPGCLEFQQTKRPVRTASAVQVRRPVFRTSVGRWRHYQHALASLLARLQ
jgi:tetratricopeptide (TPR) repeat protein